MPENNPVREVTYTDNEKQLTLNKTAEAVAAATGSPVVLVESERSNLNDHSMPNADPKTGLVQFGQSKESEQGYKPDPVVTDSYSDKPDVLTWAWRKFFGHHEGATQTTGFLETRTDEAARRDLVPEGSNDVDPIEVSPQSTPVQPTQLLNTEPQNEYWWQKIKKAFMGDGKDKPPMGQPQAMPA